MNDPKREILSQVAAGTISAAEGAARLESLEAPAAAAPVARPAQPTPRQVKVISVFGTANILGDPSVDFAVADGQHRARQEGDTLVIEHTPIGEDVGFYFGGGRAVNGLDIHGRSLSVRMNPELALLASVQAGNVRIDAVHGPITADVQAGNCVVNGFRSPLNVVAQAGNVTAGGRLESGASKIRCEMGSVKVNLEKGSSVRITARTTMGKVSIEGASAGSASVNGGQEVTVGSGAGTLDCECTMGSVRVFAD